MQFQLGFPLLLVSCAGEPILKDSSKEPSFELAQRSAGPAPLKLLGPVFEAVVSGPDALQESVAFFCVDWMEQCEALQEDFRRFGRALAEDLNGNTILEPRIRLVEVNCAEDKVLCNRQQVDAYPSIIRYVHGAREQVWEGSLGSKYKHNLKAMQNWLRKHMGAKVERRAPLEAPDEEMTYLDTFRMAASAGSLIALTVVVIKSGIEMVRSGQTAVRLSRGMLPEQDVKDQSRTEATSSSSRIAEMLPEEWVLQRDNMDL